MKHLSVFVLLFVASAVWAEGFTTNLNVTFVYQLKDEANAAIEFFTQQKVHKCGGKPSNQYRSYSDDKVVAERKFQLILAAFNADHVLNVKPIGCEGDAMLVGAVGISRPFKVKK